MKPDLKKMDLDSLDELISRCEDSMCQPFKKKKAEPIEQPESESDESSSEEQPSDKPDLSEMDMDDLLKMYEELKESKE